MREYFVWLAKILTIVVVFCLIVPLFIGVVIGAASGVKGGPTIAGKNKIGVVELVGEIIDSKDVVADIEDFANDESIDGIVLRIDSPGGAVGPSEDIYSAVLRAKAAKPVVAALGGVAASGGYYAAVGCNKIFAQPSSITGSIGVIMQIPNFRKIADLVGFDIVTIKAGKMKDVGNSFREMTQEERAYLEKTAGTVHENFMAAVATGRSMERAKVGEIADGRIFVGSEALKLGLVDSLGDVPAAARGVYEILNRALPADGEKGSQPTLIYPDDSLRDLKKIFGKLESSVSMIFARSVEMKFIAQ